MDANTHYTYVISYWTETDRTMVKRGFIRNHVEESIAGLTRDRVQHLPGKTSTHIEVDKEWVKDEIVPGAGDADDKVYSQWRISFKRPSGGLERALAEDTLPYT